ncbi:conserved exported hypothetical protein [Candidatus Accumulibacter aalborgensis]|uniref:Lipoprotein n=1 Tax=Candidatus Accumulibacter aalborgensis TaxID=1860102 RepID=A0A1A8XF06_9PROT|nr:hypothetical protein [Candidatus Accumulibacter aalborgensis]SBT03774.1 conserved exported hypothetical protein [Candidatus Accumulibacter aalborgensis]
MCNRLNLWATLAVPALLLSVSAPSQCADSTPPTRVRVEGTPYFLDEAAVKIKSDVATFKLYTSPEASDQGTDSVLNCASREFSALTGGQWSAPYRVLAGESLYPVGKKLCDWDAKGFFQRFSF